VSTSLLLICRGRLFTSNPAQTRCVRCWLQPVLDAQHEAQFRVAAVANGADTIIICCYFCFVYVVEVTGQLDGLFLSSLSLWTIRRYDTFTI
jgi:hypothetical protein